MEVYIRPRLSHSNSLGNDAEKDTAGCRAFNRKYIVIGGGKKKRAHGTISNIYGEKKGSMKMNADTFYGICTINYPPPGVGNGGAR